MMVSGMCKEYITTQSSWMCFLRFHLATPGQMEIYHKGPFSGLSGHRWQAETWEIPMKKWENHGEIHYKWRIVMVYSWKIHRTNWGIAYHHLKKIQRVLVCSSLCFYGFIWFSHMSFSIKSNMGHSEFPTLKFTWGKLLYFMIIPWIGCAPLPASGLRCVPSHFIGTLVGTMDRWHLSKPWIESTTCHPWPFFSNRITVGCGSKWKT